MLNASLAKQLDYLRYKVNQSRATSWGVPHDQQTTSGHCGK